jgi:hypothetical protein
MTSFDPEAHVHELQAEIDSALALLNPGWIESIALEEHQSDVDLRSNAEVEVTPTRGRMRTFDVRSAACMVRVCSSLPWFDGPRTLGGKPTDVFRCGTLIVVSHITGETILRGVLSFVNDELCDGAVQWFAGQGEGDGA